MGPEAITPDGCSVELYALLTPRDELAMVQAVAPPGVAVLELGAGAGRVTRVLVAAGYAVTAVDESREMLARIEGLAVDLVPARIQDLDLGRKYDAVLLMSYLINADDDVLRHGLLTSCRRHTTPEGVVLVQAHPPQWFDRAEEVSGVDGDIALWLHSITRPDPRRLTATVEYTHQERRWSHTFTARRLEERDMRFALEGAGLAFDRWVDDEHAWFSARVQQGPRLLAIQTPMAAATAYASVRGDDDPGFSGKVGASAAAG